MKWVSPSTVILFLGMSLGGMGCGSGVSSRELQGDLRKEPERASAEPAEVGTDEISPLSPNAPLEDERNSIDVFKKVAPSVVFVTQKRTVVQWGQESEVAAGSGSGFIWDKDGYVITNYHVIKGAESLVVTLAGDRTFPARVVGAEPRKDVAVLKIDAPKELLVPIAISAAKTIPEVGEKAIAIGNPFGLDHTLTTGVVSAVGRDMAGAGGVTIRDMIQTDAAINPGNSGGPLLNSSGVLIGMNTMIFSRSGQSAGIGFAVPSPTIARVVPQIIRHGHVKQVGFGVQIDPLGRLERRARTAGVIVLEVSPESPAARAGISGIKQAERGIELGDILVELDGKPVRDYDDLYTLLDERNAGEKVQVGLSRGGKDRRVVTMELISLDP